MRIPAAILILLLAPVLSLAQQSGNSDQSQPQSPPASDSQNQSKSQSQSQPDKSTPERKRLPLGKQPTTADENPFPEAISKKAADAGSNSTPEEPSADNAKSSDASKPGAQPTPGYSSSRTGLRSLDDADSSESRISDGAGGYIYNPKLAAQDVKVGSFYFTSGDYKGAYARYKEATKVDPGNADAVFGLAESARALKLDSEATDNYRIYLDALPDGPKAKTARKALAALGQAPKK